MRTSLPLHRSLFFWAGILVITFIGWVWWASLVDGGHGLKRGIAKDRAWFAGSASGTCYFLDYSWTASSPRIRQPTPATPGKTEFSHGDFPREAFPPGSDELPAVRGNFPSSWAGTLQDGQGFAIVHLAGSAARTSEEAFLSYRTSGFILPCWQLLLAIFVPWVALLLARARRMRKKMESRVGGDR